MRDYILIRPSGKVREPVLGDKTLMRVLGRAQDYPKFERDPRLLVAWQSDPMAMPTLAVQQESTDIQACFAARGIEVHLQTQSHPMRMQEEPLTLVWAQVVGVREAPDPHQADKDDLLERESREAREAAKEMARD